MTTFSTTTVSIMTVSIKIGTRTLSIMTLILTTFIVMLKLQHSTAHLYWNAECHCPECHCGKCRGAFREKFNSCSQKKFFSFLALLNFAAINNTAVLQTGAFVTVNHFQPNLIFEGQVLGSIPQLTAINFIFSLNLNTECEFEYNKNLRQTKYLFIIY